VAGSDAGFVMWKATQGTEYFIFVHGSAKVGDFALSFSRGEILELSPK
jgi:hypothetical protein